MNRLCKAMCKERRQALRFSHIGNARCCATDCHTCLQVVYYVGDQSDEDEEDQDDQEDDDVALHDDGGVRMV